MQVYGENAMKKTAVSKWIERLSEGREQATVEEMVGRRITCRTDENIDKIRQIERAHTLTVYR